MNRRTLMAVLAVVALGFVMGSTAEAGGGGGAKKNATIKVNNGQLAGNMDMAVICLPTNQVPNPAWQTNPAQFTAAGGKTVSAGATIPFTLAPGWGNVWVISPALGGPFVVSAPFSTSAGKTYTYLINGTDKAPTIK